MMLASSDKGSLRGYARRQGSGGGRLIGRTARDSPGSGEQTDPQECRASDRTPPPRGSGVPIFDTCFSQTKDKAKGERKRGQSREPDDRHLGVPTPKPTTQQMKRATRASGAEAGESKRSADGGQGGARRQTITNILHTGARRCLHLRPIT